MVQRTLACHIFFCACVIFAAAEEADQFDEVPLSSQPPGIRGARAALTEAVSQRDCRHGQEFVQATGGGTAEPADYVFTTILWYKPYDTRAFLTTFRRFNQAARIAMVVAEDQWQQLHEPFCEYAAHYGADFYSVEPGTHWYYPAVLVRFLAYKDILRGLGPAAVRNVLMTDARDVLFQGDPFSPAALPAPQGRASASGGTLPYVLFTEEGDARYRSTMRNDSTDREWIRSCFNDSVVEVVLDATVVCAGTILGGRDAVGAYLQLMSDVAHFVVKESCISFGVDQAIHNYIVHYLKPRRPDLLRFEALRVANDDSPIYTLGLVDVHSTRLTSKGVLEVLNGKRIAAPVLHQTDRKGDISNHTHFLSIDMR